MTSWKEDIQQALQNLGGVAHRSKIHAEVKKIRKQKLPKRWKETIQECLQVHSSDSEAYTGRYPGKENIFKIVDRKGSGIWGLRNFLNSQRYYLFLHPYFSSFHRLFCIPHF